MTDTRIFKRSEVDPNRRPGWIADLSPADRVDPDFYWWFPTRKAAAAFLSLVDGGMDAEQAANEVATNRSGAQPDTSLHLGQERKDWLNRQGGIQPTIKRLIDQAMQS